MIPCKKTKIMNVRSVGLLMLVMRQIVSMDVIAFQIELSNNKDLFFLNDK